MAELTPNLTKLLKEHFPDEAERNTAVWRHPQGKKWIAKHWALMRIMRRLHAKVEEPVHILERCEPDYVALLQRMSVEHEGKVYRAHAYGVAFEGNNRNLPGYHYAMAKKRGEDQCAIDLIEQVYDIALRKDVLYGEEEADEFAEPEAGAPVVRIKTERLREKEAIKAELDKEVDGLVERILGPLDEWRERILNCTTHSELEALYNDEYTPNVDRFSKKENKELQEMFATHGKSLK